MCKLSNELLSRDNKVFSMQIRNLSMYFSSIKNADIREAIVSFIREVGEFSGIEGNEQAILSALTSREFLTDMMSQSNQEESKVLQAVNLKSIPQYSSTTN